MQLALARSRPTSAPAQLACAPVKVRDQRDRASGAFQPLGECALVDQHPREVVVGHAMVGLQRNCPAVAVSTACRPAARPQHVAIIQMHVRQPDAPAAPARSAAEPALVSRTDRRAPRADAGRRDRLGPPRAPLRRLPPGRAAPPDDGRARARNAGVKADIGRGPVRTFSAIVFRSDIDRRRHRRLLAATFRHCAGRSARAAPSRRRPAAAKTCQMSVADAEVAPPAP